MADEATGTHFDAKDFMVRARVAIFLLSIAHDCERVRQHFARRRARELMANNSVSGPTLKFI